MKRWATDWKTRKVRKPNGKVGFIQKTKRKRASRTNLSLKLKNQRKEFPNFVFLILSNLENLRDPCQGCRFQV